MNRISSITLLCSTLVGATAVATVGLESDQLILRESFDAAMYDAGRLDQQAPEVTGFDTERGWYVQNFDARIVPDDGLEYEGLPSQPGCLRLTTRNRQFAQTGRLMSAELPADADQLFISYLVRLDDSQRGIIAMNVGREDEVKGPLDFGLSDGQPLLRYQTTGDPESASASETAVAVGETALLVLRVDIDPADGDDDTIRFFVNPESDSEPADDDAVIEVTGRIWHESSEFGSLQLRRQKSVDGELTRTVVDELRIASTYAGLFAE
ncbi:MAG: hypothetical protein AAGD32_05395 [Planctomycetota bacterium]